MNSKTQPKSQLKRTKIQENLCCGNIRNETQFKEIGNYRGKKRKLIDFSLA
jgi:hypothetical protein